MKNVSMPDNADELAQFIYCCRWMYLQSDFIAPTATLTTVLEQAYSKSGKRSNRCIRHIRLRSLSWGLIQVKAFLELQGCCLRNAVQLGHPDRKKVVCVYTDAVERC